MLTQEELKKLLHYDPETGIFTRKVAVNNSVKPGDIAGVEHPSESGKTYYRIRINGKRYLAHVLAWIYMYGEHPNLDIDHINGNGRDNRIGNLRHVSRSENAKNARRYKTNRSGVTGVYFHNESKKYRAMIRYNGVLKHLGVFEKIDEAVKARRYAENILGFHENHGSERPL